MKTKTFCRLNRISSFRGSSGYNFTNHYIRVKFKIIDEEKLPTFDYSEMIYKALSF